MLPFGPNVNRFGGKGKVVNLHAATGVFVE